MSKLIRKPIERHPWRLHKWQDVDGMAGPLGLIKQCSRCHAVEVLFPLTMTTHRGDHSMLVSQARNRAEKETHRDQ